MKKTSKKIITSLTIIGLSLTLVASCNLMLEGLIRPKKKLSNTLVPVTIILFQLMIVVHLWVYYLNCPEDKNKFLVKKIAIILTVLAPINILVALAIGGIVFKFKACVIVYSLDLLAWLLILAICYYYYGLQVSKNNLLIGNTKKKQ